MQIMQYTIDFGWYSSVGSRTAQEIKMIKTVLVHLMGTSGDQAVLTAAQAVARPFAAHLECLHIRPDLARMFSREIVAEEAGEDLGAISEVIESLQKQSSELARRAEDEFAAFCDREDVLRAESPPSLGKINAAYRELLGGQVDRLTEQSRCHDLLVVKGGLVESGGMHPIELGRLIMSTGRPILLAPDASHRRLRNVVIAWKDVPEAARAVNAAMPLLEKAEKIFVLTTREGDEPVSRCDNVVTQLAWHGLCAEAHSVVPGERDAAHAVLEMARAAGADLLVMGAYGHSRLRETVLGGFTRSVLYDASLPVFVLH
jgi:nucleotide-binding universal stress UspA family protein